MVIRFVFFKCVIKIFLNKSENLLKNTFCSERLQVSSFFIFSFLFSLSITRRFPAQCFLEDNPFFLNNLFAAETTLKWCVSAKTQHLGENPFKCFCFFLNIWVFFGQELTKTKSLSLKNRKLESNIYTAQITVLSLCKTVCSFVGICFNKTFNTCFTSPRCSARIFR